MWVTEKEKKKKVVFFLFPDFSKCDLEKWVYSFSIAVNKLPHTSWLKTTHVYYLISVGQHSGHGSPGLPARVSPGYRKELGRSVFSSGDSLGRICFQSNSGGWHIHFHGALWLMALTSLWLLLEAALRCCRWHAVPCHMAHFHGQFT